MKLNELLTNAFLVIAFSSLLFYGASFLDRNISHDAPYNYQSSDAFQYQVRADDIKTMGNYRNEAFWSSAGYKDVVGFYPPVLYHITALFSFASGLETFDAMPFLLFFFMIIAAFGAYYFIKEINASIAILAMALFPFLLNPSTISGITTGHGPSILAQFFLVSFLLAFLYRTLKNFFLIIGFLVSAVLLTHTSEVMPLAFFGFLYVAIFWIWKKGYKEELMPVLKAGIVAIILSAYYLFIFSFTWLKSGSGYLGAKPEAVWTEGMGLYLSDLKLLLIPIAIGFAISLYMVFKKPSVQNIGFLSIFIVSYANYVGLSHWIFQLRFYWPIYLSLFFALGLYYPIKLALKDFKVIHALPIGLLLFIIIGFFFIKVESAQGIMQKPYWDGLMWIKENTPKNAIVYFFFDDVYRHNALLRNAQRTHYLTSTSGFQKLASEGKIARQMPSKLLGDCCGTGYPYKKSLFSYGYHWDEDGMETGHYKEWDLCKMDYYVLNLQAQPIVAQYNKNARELLMKKPWIKETYNNGVVSILKNEKPGEECVA